MNSFLRLCCLSVFLAPDTGGASGGSESPAPTEPPAPTETAPPVVAVSAPTPEPKPTIFARAAALLQDRGALAGQITTLQETNAGLVLQLATSATTITDLRGQLKALTDGQASLESAIAGLKQEKVTVAETVAQLGFPAAQLPSPAGEPEAVDLKTDPKLHGESRLAAAFRAQFAAASLTASRN